MAVGSKAVACHGWGSGLVAIIQWGLGLWGYRAGAWFVWVIG